MKLNTLNAFILSLGVAATFSGCVGAMKELTHTDNPIELVKKDYALINPSSTISLSEAEYYINGFKGTVILKGGEQILDEDGSIFIAYKINNMIYYIVENNISKICKLKDQNGKLIKDFGKTYKLVGMVQDGKLNIATINNQNKKELFNSNLYDNIYSFDGQTIKLIDKNKYIPGIAYGRNVLQFYKIQNSQGYINDVYNLTDYVNGKQIKPKLIPEGGYTGANGKKGYEYKYIAGAVGDTVVYMYMYKYLDKENKIYTWIMEAYNPILKKQEILIDNKQEEFTFLTNGQEVVFRTGQKTIDLRTLSNAEIDDNFRVIPISYTQSVPRGSITKSKNKYTLDDFDSSNKAKQSFMFKKN